MVPDDLQSFKAVAGLKDFADRQGSLPQYADQNLPDSGGIVND
jgi:hypothetical protein